MTFLSNGAFAVAISILYLLTSLHTAALAELLIAFEVGKFANG